MQYYFYLDKVLMPVTPASMRVKIKNKNETLDLANGGEWPVLQPAGLTEVQFDLLLPASPYPFAVYSGSFQEPGYFLELFQRLKTGGTPFPFLVIRTLTAETALKFAARLLPYSADIAKAITGDENTAIRSSHARTLLRNGVSGETAVLSDTSMTVTLEEYEIVEDAEKYGRDFYVSLTLRQYPTTGGETGVYTKK